MARLALATLVALALVSAPPGEAQAVEQEASGPTVDAARSSSAAALAPRTISYQGVLSDATGAPVPDATYTVRIALHLTATGGTETYAETHSVSTTDGAFTLAIGSGTPQTSTWSAVVFDRPWWVETSVDGGALAPRTELRAVPFTRGLALPLAAQSDEPGVALSVTSSAASGANAGIHGVSLSDDGSGVVGEAPNYGLFGRATRDANFAYGVWGESVSTTGRGVLGKATSLTGVTYGVVGQSDSDAGRGVYGVSISPTGTPSGVYGRVVSPDGYAGYFVGGRGVRVEGEVAASRIVYTTPRPHVVSIPPSAFMSETSSTGAGKRVDVEIGLGGAYLRGEDSSTLFNGPILAPLMLPDGAEVTDFSCHTFDGLNLDVALTCRLERRDPPTFQTRTVLATTPLSTGNYQELVATFSPFAIDNQTSTYTVSVTSSGTDYWTEESFFIRVMKVTVGYRVSEAE